MLVSSQTASHRNCFQKTCQHDWFQNVCQHNWFQRACLHDWFQKTGAQKTCLHNWFQMTCQHVCLHNWFHKRLPVNFILKAPVYKTVFKKPCQHNSIQKGLSTLMNDFKSSVFTVKCTHKRSEKEVVQCWSNTKGNTVSGYRFISLVQTFVPFWKLLHKLLLFLTAKEYTVAVWATQNTAFISTCNTTVLTAFISTCNTDCLQHTLTPCPIPPPPQLQLWNCVTIRSLYPAQTAVSQQCHCHCHHNQITVHKQPLSLPSQSDHCTQLRQLCPNNATVTVLKRIRFESA